MLFESPIAGRLKPHRDNYPKHPLAAGRPAGTRLPRVTHDFGPSGIKLEPPMDWRGGESDIFGRKIPPGHYEDFHQGLDISTGGCADDVLAAAPGFVESAGPNNVDANVVVLNHGVVNGREWKTRYAHLQTAGLIRASKDKDKPTVVVAGQVLGRIGTTGAFSTGCHLHFAITRNGKPVDPWRRLRQNTSIDPDLPRPVPVAAPVKEPDVPTPMSDDDYVAGQAAVIANATTVAAILNAPSTTAKVIRTVAIGDEELWLPTCFVKGDLVGTTERWLTRWFDGSWEFTHFSNISSLTLFAAGTESDGDVGINVDPSADFEVDHQAVPEP